MEITSLMKCGYEIGYIGKLLLENFIIEWYVY